MSSIDGKTDKTIDNEKAYQKIMQKRRIREQNERDNYSLNKLFQQ